MEEFDEIFNKVNVPTNDLTPAIIQDILLKVKHNRGSHKQIFCNEIADKLWCHLKAGLNRFDDQLLCGTCFYTVLTFTDKQEFYINEVLGVITNELVLRDEYKKENYITSHAVSLMYGMFQSAFLTQKATKDIPNIDSVLHTIFKLLLIMAYEYSRFTFVSFKTINSLKKVIGTELQDFIYTKENQVKLLNLINHNWENPITGVRDLNKDIFQTLISILDECMFKTILEEINSFYWNKAKYLMLSEIVEQSNKDATNLLAQNNWIDGLLNSLYKPGLVSAGADMYYAIFKKLKSEDEWCSIFLNGIITMLSGSSIKAIENFSNYWCLTTFKRFPSIYEVIIRELKNVTDIDQNIYSSLCITKQANKLSLAIKDWTLIDNFKEICIEKLVLHGLEHINSHIRMLAFDILCVSPGKSMPINMEYELVLNFLHNNINSDCTVLRISILNSFNTFLMQIHVTLLNNINNGQDCNNENFEEFCRKFQKLVINSIDIGGNYQRKITCIKLSKCFLNSLNEVPRKRQKQPRKSSTTVMEMLKEKVEWTLLKEQFIMKLINLLKDPSEDIRANVIELLLAHYSMELRKTHLINNLIESALANMQSKFFYYISCGHSIFKLVINLLIKETHQEAKFKNVEDICQFAYNELMSEYKLKRSVVESIENGKQLHSFISILHAVIEVCNQHAYEIKIEDDSMLKLLDVLEGVSNQFAWEEETSTSSDFSKISDKVESIIMESGYNSASENDETKISGLHQIVLNCLWLNVKASCDLSALLIQFIKGEKQPEISDKCLQIIAHVLETCRHKGAIEAAGVALGQGIRFLTSLPEDSGVSKLPYSLLQNKLHDLISEAGKMASVTRRGAGLSIMVHRIVSNDMKKGKPLFHCFMNTLLKVCSNDKDIPNKLENDINTGNEKDLPKAIYIHFLTRIVTDSSLASDMMYYSAELAELAFDNLTSPHWQIRNAALQLYGALIPKLIGQKKASGTDEETIATVACDELRTHSPKLWKYINSQLKNGNYENKVQYHSNLIPILNMLANCARRYNLAYDMYEQKELDADLFKSLMLLLDSPIYTVRRLTARCIFNIYKFDVIYDTIVNQEFVSENYLHGCLMLISSCHKCFNNDLFEDNFSNLKSKFSEILNGGEHCYLCKELFEAMFCDGDLDVDKFKQTLTEMDSNRHSPGIFLWANARVQKFVINMTWEKMPEILKIILDCKDFEHYCEYVLQKLDKDNGIPRQVQLEVADILLTFKYKFNSSVVWKIIYKLSMIAELSECVDITDTLGYMQRTVVSYKLRYVLPLIARITASNGNENSLMTISKIIYSLTDSETTDVDMRYIAAIANNQLGVTFNRLPDSVKITAIKSAVILLQDEDEDVRNSSVYFYRNMTKSVVTLQPYLSLFKILGYTNLCSFLNQAGIQNLCDDLSDLLVKKSNRNSIDEYNPFANDSKNIYLEVKLFEQLIENLKNCIGLQ